LGRKPATLFVNRVGIEATAEAPLVVCVEPWPEEVVVPAGRRYDFVGESSQPGEIEMRWTADGGAVIYLWPGSTVHAIDEGKVVWRGGEFAVPNLPAGLTTRQFVDELFGTK